jgi:hypothetical protein
MTRTDSSHLLVAPIGLKPVILAMKNWSLRRQEGAQVLMDPR